MAILKHSAKFPTTDERLDVDVLSESQKEFNVALLCTIRDILEQLKLLNIQMNQISDLDIDMED